MDLMKAKADQLGDISRPNVNTAQPDIHTSTTIHNESTNPTSSAPMNSAISILRTETPSIITSTSTSMSISTSAPTPNPTNLPPSYPTTRSKTYLQTLLSKSLRITISDTRMFRGEFKCTDSERNLILARCYEYRFPTPPPAASPAAATRPEVTVPMDGAMKDDVKGSWDIEGGDIKGGDLKGGNIESRGKKTVMMDLSSRYIGLVVIPGKYIVRIEVEEFESQIGRGGSVWARGLEAIEV